MVGVPLGIVAGRFVVRSLTSTLGIVPTIDVPVWLVAVGGLVPLVVAGILTIVPALRATRASVNRLPRPR